MTKEEIKKEAEELFEKYDNNVYCTLWDKEGFLAGIDFAFENMEKEEVKKKAEEGTTTINQPGHYTDTWGVYYLHEDGRKEYKDNVSVFMIKGEILSGIVHEKEKTPHTCPVCGGKGIVPPGFYSGNNELPRTSSSVEPCRSCKDGIILG